MANCSHSHFDRATVRSCVYNEKDLNFQKGEILLPYFTLWPSGTAFLGIIQDIIIFVCIKDPCEGVFIL